MLAVSVPFSVCFRFDENLRSAERAKKQFYKKLEKTLPRRSERSERSCHDTNSEPLKECKLPLLEFFVGIISRFLKSFFGSLGEVWGEEKNEKKTINKHDFWHKTRKHNFLRGVVGLRCPPAASAGFSYK